MATICFGPPPLPPNKKSCRHHRNTTNSNNSKNNFLSSTYHSFRDPAEESEIIVMTVRDSNETSSVRDNKCRRVSHTNSLKRDKDVKLSLVRSHSEGNLSKKNDGGGMTAPMTINKYIKVLSGSWKNLLNCKYQKREKKLTLRAAFVY